MLKAANLNLARTQLMALRSCFSARLSSSTNPSGENSQLTKEAKTEPKPETVENTQSINQTPTTMVQTSGFSKFLIYKFSNTKYNSKEEVPDQVPAQQLAYARDKGRAQMTIYLIGLTILISFGVAWYGKREHSKGRRHTDEIIRQHAEYSQAHRDMLKK